MINKIGNLFNDSITKYSNISIIIGKINIKTNPNDLIGLYVNSELRGKTNIIKIENEYWFNLSAYCNGVLEKANLVYFDSIKNTNINCLEIEISNGKSIGTMNDPINIFDTQINNSLVHEITYENANLEISLLTKNIDLNNIILKLNDKKLYNLEVNNFCLNEKVTIPFKSNIQQEITFEIDESDINAVSNKVVYILPGQNISINLNLHKEFDYKFCLDCLEINKNENMICLRCNSELEYLDHNKNEIEQKIKNRIRNNDKIIKENKNKINKIEDTYQSKIKYNKNLIKIYENRIREIKFLLKRGLVKNISYDEYQKKINKIEIELSQLNINFGSEKNLLSNENLDFENENKRIKDIDLNRNLSKFILLISDNINETIENDNKDDIIHIKKDEKSFNR